MVVGLCMHGGSLCCMQLGIECHLTPVPYLLLPIFTDVLGHRLGGSMGVSMPLPLALVQP